MTHARLVQELGPGEFAYQVAYDELEADARSKRAEQAAQASRSMIGRRR